MAHRSSVRRLQVRVAHNLYEEAETCAKRSGVSLGSFIRLLLEDALASKPNSVPAALVGRGDVETRVATLASLVASENALLTVEKIFPKDHWDGAALRTQAIERAEQRLADVRTHLEREEL
jgi:antitoxin component of RelBE/YafQ-DinJ toxin-antitoxin module